MADKKASQRKASALKRSAARSAGRTRATLATPGKVVESGMGGYAVAKAAQAAMKTVAKKAPKPKTTTQTTKNATRRASCPTCGRTNIVSDPKKAIIACRGKGCGRVIKLPKK